MNNVLPLQNPVNAVPPQVAEHQANISERNYQITLIALSAFGLISLAAGGVTMTWMFSGFSVLGNVGISIAIVAVFVAVSVLAYSCARQNLAF